MFQTLDMWPNNPGIYEVNAFINNENELWPHEHNHTYYEFMIIERGSLVQEINGNDIVMNKNDICLLRPDAIHFVKQNGNDSVVLVNFEISQNFFNSIAKTLGVNVHDDLLKDKIVFSKCSEYDIHNYMQLLTIAYNDSNFYTSQVCLKNIVTALLTKLVSEYLCNKIQINDNSTIASILYELKKPDNFTLSIEKICRNKSYSHEHISRLFKQANLDKPNKIFLKNKLAFASTILRTSNMSIIKIAELCGIYTLAYFNKTFKLEYGLTPSQYRKNNKVHDKLTAHELGKRKVII